MLLPGNLFAIPTFSSIPGNLQQISVGADGATWGLNVWGQIYTYDFQTRSWINVPGALAKISVGNNESIWGVNSSGLIFRWDDVAQSWDYIPGALAQIAVGADGDVWGLNAGGQIYRYNSDTSGWTEIPGTLAQISVGFDGAVWGVNTNHQIYRFNSGTGLFDNVSGSLAEVSVGADGDVWGLNPHGQIYRFNRLTQSWNSVSGSFAQISVGSGGNVWGLSASGAISTFDTQTQSWTSVAGTLTQVRASATGSVWGVNAAGDIFELSPSTLSRPGVQQVPGQLAHIAVAPDGNVWGLNASQQIWTFNPQTQGWTYIPGLLAQIAVGAEGEVWGLNSAGQIWTYNAGSQTWTYVAGSLAQIAVGGNGAVWGINSSGQIYRFNSHNANWTYVPGSLSQISIGADGSVWGLNSSGQIWTFNFQTHNWSYVPGTLAKISVGSSASVWGLDSSGAIWRYDVPSGGFVPVPGAALASIAAAFDGSAWGLNSAGQLLRFDVASQSWITAQGAELSIFCAGNDSAAWGVSAASNIYSYQSGSVALPLSITSVSNNSPSPLSPLYVGTSGINTAAPVNVQFSDGHGYSVSVQPLHIASDGTLTVTTPLYFNFTTRAFGAGAVSLTISQEGQTSSALSVNIQDLSSAASYGMQPGAITHAVLVFDAMLLAMRINQLQAFQNLPGNTVDTTAAQTTLQTLLTAVIEARHDVDQVMLNPSTVIQDVTLGNGAVLQFDANALDMMDRVNAQFLLQTFANLPVVTGAAASEPEHGPRPRDESSLLKQLISFMELANGSKDAAEGLYEYPDAKDWIDRTQDAAKASGGLAEALVGVGAVAETVETRTFGVAAALAQDARVAVDAWYQDGRFVYGWASGNQAVEQSAVQAMQAAETENEKALADLVLALAGGPTYAETLGDASTVASFLRTVFENEGTPEEQANQAQLNVAVQAQNLPQAESHDLAYVNGTVDISNSTGVAAAQTGIDLSSNGIDFGGLADPAGNYQVMVTLNDSTFNYSDVTLQAFDPVTDSTLNSVTIDLSSLSSANPFQAPTLTGSCVDTDDDEDDPDCDSSGGIRKDPNAPKVIKLPAGLLRLSSR